MSQSRLTYEPMRFSKRLKARIEDLARSAQGGTGALYTPARELAERLKTGGYTDRDALCQDLLDLQRLTLIANCGRLGDSSLADKIAAHPPLKWADFGDFPGDDYLKDRFALHTVDAYQEHDKPPLLIKAGSMTKNMLPRIIDHALRARKPFDVSFEDHGFAYGVIGTGSLSQARRAARKLARQYDGIGRRIELLDSENGLLNDYPWPVSRLAQPALDIWYQGRAKAHRKARAGHGLFTYTSLPTRSDANLEDMDYADYCRLFLEMADQPWEAIHKAQAHLVKELNAAKRIRFTNCDGTDLSMSIEGFTFANTHIDANIPGSEVFSAPRLDSAEGVVVAKGSYIPWGETKKVADIRLRFEKGRVVEHYARRGNKVLHRVLNRDEGAKSIGEIAIGTNPALKRQVHSILMVEKISGSFHFALGNSYSFTNFRGGKVALDNGNRSALHWDITVMLAGKQGTIELDSHKIVDDGRFIDPRYDVLNRGWSALPESERPAYWRRKLAQDKPPPAPPRP